MHDGAVIVRDAEGKSARFDVEIVSVARSNVVEVHFDGGITVHPTLLVVKTC